MTSGKIDTYFVAANYEEVEQDGNDDNALCRFEFLEMMVRIAKGKYVDSGYMGDLAVATETLITKHVL